MVPNKPGTDARLVRAVLSLGSPRLYERLVSTWRLYSVIAAFEASAETSFAGYPAAHNTDLIDSIET